jgi:hypothetical protein
MITRDRDLKRYPVHVPRTSVPGYVRVICALCYLAVLRPNNVMGRDTRPGGVWNQTTKELKEIDVVKAAGYPDPPVRVVCNGKVVATIDYFESGSSATFCSGQIS